MKNFKVIVAALMLLAAIGPANAQSNIAHINVQQLLSEMPEMKAAQAELRKLEETYQSDLQASFQEFQTTARQFESEAASKTQAENEQRALTLQQTERRLGEARQTASQVLQEKQAELYQPILKKANDAIQSAARAIGVQYVLDASPGAGVILAEGTDLMADVKKALGF